MEHAELTREIIGRGIKVHNTLGPGFLESVYKNALAHELRKARIPFEREKRAHVFYDGIVMGEFSADLLVDSRVLVEVKAVRIVAPGNEAQLVNYQNAVNIDVGLLLNFGARRLEVKRKSRVFQQQTTRQDGQDGQDEGGYPSDSLAPRPSA